ncbi:uncharacterized protein BYT42DRAFT_560658 [Radiomyces spectabilis]|uniref:uncharacterized protein n=1 Tax=Radiomyces spectabilis TaxID=64574 RepID=UPI002220CE73|nr:uncharacterized protein BYT42DRAFT_560658 [Radiomyces spectabilis]KAI8388602.1 hypothetical protein BYT42DRAFT_560658 [Radiomyces spectabilis]
MEMGPSLPSNDNVIPTFSMSSGWPVRNLYKSDSSINFNSTQHDQQPPSTRFSDSSLHLMLGLASTTHHHAGSSVNDRERSMTHARQWDKLLRHSRHPSHSASKLGPFNSRSVGSPSLRFWRRPIRKRHNTVSTVRPSRIPISVHRIKARAAFSNATNDLVKAISLCDISSDSAQHTLVTNLQDIAESSEETDPAPLEQEADTVMDTAL